MQEAGLTTAKMHNQVITLGEWGWVLGAKNFAGRPEDLKAKLQALQFGNLKTKWLNNEAMHLITSFGKNIYYEIPDSVEVNQIQNPVLYRYYLNGNWDLY